MSRRAGAVLGGALAAVLMLASACSGVHPSEVLAGRSQVKVDSPGLVAYKKHTHVPDCPKVGRSAVGDGMPAVTVPCLGGGRSVDLSGLRGPMIVNFWASTCHPCRQEMPALAAFARSQSAVKVLGVDILDVQPAAALQLAKASNVGYPLVADPAGNLVGRKPIPRNLAIPFSLWLDASGRVVHEQAVAMTSQQQVAASARKYLGVGG